MEEMGKYFDEGFEIGIANGADGIINQVQNLARDTERAFRPSLNADAIINGAKGGKGSNGSLTAGGVVQNNYFTQRNLTPFEVIQEQKKLNKQLVGVFA